VGIVTPLQQCTHRHTATRACNSWTAASRNAKLSCVQPVASKQPRSQSCGLRDLGCHAASWLPQTNLRCGWVLKRRLINVWCGFEQSIFDETTDQWWGRRQRVSMLKEDISSTVCKLTMLILSISVTFNMTCLTVTSIITTSCQQRWPIHSCSFYKVVH